MSDDTGTASTDADDQQQATSTEPDLASLSAEQQIEHLKTQLQAARRAEDKLKGKNADPTKSAPYLSKQLAATQKELEDLRKAGMSQAEKDLQAKFDEGRKLAEGESLLKFGGQIVAARAEGMLAGRGLDAERVAAIVEHLAPSKYLADDGSVDNAALTKFIDAVAPPKTSTNGTSSATGWGTADFGNGRRTTSSAEPGAAGLAEAQKRFAKKTA